MATRRMFHLQPCGGFLSGRPSGLHGKGVLGEDAEPSGHWRERGCRRPSCPAGMVDERVVGDSQPGRAVRDPGSRPACLSASCPPTCRVWESGGAFLSCTGTSCRFLPGTARHKQPGPSGARGEERAQLPPHPPPRISLEDQRLHLPGGRGRGSWVAPGGAEGRRLRGGGRCRVRPPPAP
ncbi:hypothetical protein HPG69_008556 [Diceros bicornis minor]|uniref:Uncharacterized protein n=1 Tax=Diceros bicornis minor TaxID=77932 RepID=A0A7J7FAY2_DICBM|nr:hypothetical protein HPG69_008556 [Diceros bicornis minor]